MTVNSKFQDLINKVFCRSAEIAQTHNMLEQVALPSHVWRRHGLHGRPDGAKASLAEMLHKPDATLEQVCMQPGMLCKLQHTALTCMMHHSGY